MLRDVDQTKLNCKQLNTDFEDSPKYGTTYSTLDECQAACSSSVKSCNAINYAPEEVRDRCVSLVQRMANGPGVDINVAQ